MAAPNIANLTEILGKTATGSLSTTTSTILSNSLNSNTVFKINTLNVSNIDGVNSADVTIELFRTSPTPNTTHSIAKTVSVPADAVLIVINQDTNIYLEEGDILQGSASANSDLEFVCSYESIK